MPIFPKTNSAASVLFVGALSTLGGATAAYALSGRPVVIGKSRGPAEFDGFPGFL